MYITVHDGFDTTNWTDISGRSTKQWDIKHWATLLLLIKHHYPEIQIIQLGSKTGRPLKGTDQNLLNKTTLTEAFDILKTSLLHIDGDSGLVHAATALNVSCIVMFGPTPDYFFGYPQNKNLRAKTCVDACYWLKDNWMKECSIGFKSPKCMDEIMPQTVFKAVQALLK